MNDSNEYKISIVGAGYVGMSLACLFSQYYQTLVYDINEDKIDKIKNRISPIEDRDIVSYLKYSDRVPTATNNFDDLLDSDFVIICTPTNYNENTNQFDCSSVENTIESLQHTDATIVIKSTIPIGFTRSIRNKYSTNRILFSPEFLREGKALYDNLHPSRIIVSEGRDDETFSYLLKRCAEEDTEILIADSDEAEAIKLFSNTYLAMRVAFFNELDSFAMKKKLSSENIIRGVCLDKRIGKIYNNPSFGYGGYCLPKDTKQLKYHYNDIYNSDLIDAIVKSNDTRKMTIVDEIKKKIRRRDTVGIYRLNMKSGSDNFRQSAVLDVMNKLIDCGYKVIVYEPTINEFNKTWLCNNLEEFKKNCDLIVANRVDENLNDVMDKVFTRDVFCEN